MSLHHFRAIRFIFVLRIAINSTVIIRNTKYFIIPFAKVVLIYPLKKKKKREGGYNQILLT